MEKNVLAPWFNGELSFSLDFFSKLLCANPDKLAWGIIQRTFESEETLAHPAVRIDGFDEYVFDIVEGQFVKKEAFQGEKITFLPASVEIHQNDFVFTAGKVSCIFSRNEFLGKYKCRIMNNLLLGQNH